MRPFCWTGKGPYLWKPQLPKICICKTRLAWEYAKRMIPKDAYNLEQSSGWRSRCVHGLDLGASGGKKNKKAIEAVVTGRGRPGGWCLMPFSSDWLMRMAVFHSPGSRGAYDEPLVLGWCCWLEFKSAGMEVTAMESGEAGATVKCEHGLSNLFIQVVMPIISCICNCLCLGLRFTNNLIIYFSSVLVYLCVVIVILHFPLFGFTCHQ